MSIRTTLKLGLKNLISHPLRLVAVVLLGMIALGLLGTAFSASQYDELTAKRNSMYEYESDMLIRATDGFFTPTELQEVSEASQLPLALVTRDRRIVPDWSAYGAPNGISSDLSEIMFQTPVRAAVVSEAFLSSAGAKLIGRLPQNQNEIVIPVCMYHFLHMAGYYDNIASPQYFDGTQMAFDPDCIYPVESMEQLAHAGYRVAVQDFDSEGTFEAVIVGVMDYGACKYDHTYENYSADGAPFSIHDTVLVSEDYYLKIISSYGYNGAAAVAVYAMLSEDASVNDSLFYYVMEREELNLESTLINQIEDISEQLNEMTVVFFYVGIGLIVFCAMLIYQFISFLLEKRKREIGILRALGASKGYIRVLFLLESLALALLQGAAAVIFAAATIPIVNAILANKLAVKLVFMTFSPLAIVAILGVGIVVSILSALIPIDRVARQMPVEAIRFNED